MGKKRRLLAAKGKFGKKHNTHPRYRATNSDVPVVNTATDTTTNTKLNSVEETKVVVEKTETTAKTKPVAASVKTTTTGKKQPTTTTTAKKQPATTTTVKKQPATTTTVKKKKAVKKTSSKTKQ